VLDVKAGAIEPTPDLGGGPVEHEFILGVGKHGHKVVFLLDIAQVLEAHDVATLRAAAAA